MDVRAGRLGRASLGRRSGRCGGSGTSTIFCRASAGWGDTNDALHEADRRGVLPSSPLARERRDFSAPATRSAALSTSACPCADKPALRLDRASSLPWQFRKQRGSKPRSLILLSAKNHRIRYGTLHRLRCFVICTHRSEKARQLAQARPVSAALEQTILQ